MNSVRSNNISLKYQRFTTLGSKDIGIINSEFVAKTQFQILNLFFVRLFNSCSKSFEDSHTFSLKKFLQTKFCKDSVWEAIQAGNTLQVRQ